MLDVKSVARKGRFSSISFRAADGNMLFLLGPNGAGKSSLLECLAGYCAVEGQILLNQEPLLALSPERLAQRRAWLPQSVSIDPYIRLEQAFELALSPLGLTLFSPQVDGALNAIFDGLDLARFKTRPVGSLSGGEQQRVNIGLRLLQVWPSINPGASLLLLDEPTTGLDLCHQQGLFKLLQQLKASGLLIVISVHDLNLALSYADQVLLLKAGQAAFFGEVEQALSSDMVQRVFNVRSELIVHQHKQYLMVL